MSSRLFTPTNKVDALKDTNGTAMSVEPQVMTVGGGKTLDPNRYATKKTVAQGMLDIALLTANASQLKYVLRIGEKHEFYSLMLGLIITSLILQGLTAVLLTGLSVISINNPSKQWLAVTINHVTLGVITLITALDAIKLGFDYGFQGQKVGDTFIP
ncbi:ninjurin-2-like isoform X4 [Penaeus chinensis]|uniref:ninjurin-2-like isoform X4 n=1 Tax=Penaeus chinensis TaxID=139456 RepID=UPI001FB75AEC|nr:ninjurin-2-like isoform X4 [Penaeus chinensis]